MDILTNVSNLFSQSNLLGIIIAFIGGIISSFNPCMISTIPLIVGYLNIGDNVEKGKSKYSNFLITFVFSLGIIITFVSLGIISTLFGKNLKIYGGIIYIILAVILTIVALKMFHVINIEKYCKRPILKKNLIGAFFLGILGGIFDSPCSTPVLVAILAFVAQKSDLMYGIVLMIFYSIGHVIIIIIAGKSADIIKRISNNEKYIKFLKYFEYLFGVVLIIFALYLFYMGF